MSTTVAKSSRSPMERVKGLLLSLLGPSNASLFPFIPRPIKILLLLVFFLNRRSWPLVWHYRVWKPVIAIRWSILRHARSLPAKRRWLGQNSPVGKSPFKFMHVHKCFAGIDDIDYNGHLSNSCYAKSLDAVRMSCAVDGFPAIFGDGIWMALGGAHYQFVREIPYGTQYEVRTSVGGWEDKWMFLVHYFVSYPKTKKNKSTPPTKAPENGLPSITTPSSPSLLPPTSTGEKLYWTLPQIEDKTFVPEGAVLHCVAVSTYCFKIGRITVPPQVAFIGSGYGEASRRRWFRVQDLRFAPPTSSASSGKGKKEARHNRMSDMFRGEWKTDEQAPPGFWQLDEYEEERKMRMERIFGGMQEGFKALKI